MYVYGKQDGSWAQLHRLTAETPPPEELRGLDRGFRKPLDRRIDGAGGWARCGVRVREQGDGWRQIAGLTATGEATGDSLGTSVAIDGDIALVGAGGADSGRGAVYVFRADGSGAWTQTARIAAPGGTVPDDRYAEVVALHGGTAVVAAARADSGRGAVYLYRGDGWSQVDRIAPDSLTANARFGSAIAVGEDVALIGAPGYQGFRGAVYGYSPSDAGWTLAGRVPFEGTPQERFGSAISISGLEAWVSAPGADRFAGAVYAVGPERAQEANPSSSASSTACPRAARSAVPSRWARAWRPWDCPARTTGWARRRSSRERETRGRWLTGS